MKANMSLKKHAVKYYLKEINKLTKVCKVVEKTDMLWNSDCVHFEIVLKKDFAINSEYSGHIGISRGFEEANERLMKKYFEKSPSYNNDCTIWWAFDPVYRIY